MRRTFGTKVPLVFYSGSTGKEPVRACLQGLDENDRHAIGLHLMRAQWRWPIGMPLCRPMGQGLWEARTDLPNGRTARVFVCLDKGVLVALHDSSRSRGERPTGIGRWRADA